MKSVTIYDRTSGALLRTFEGPTGLLSMQLSANEAMFDGLLPLAGCRIDLITGEPLYFEPPAPSPEHVWDAARQAHVLSAEGMKKRQVQGEIQMLEANQLRALRELALGDDKALDRLAEIDVAIAAKRGKLNGRTE